MKKPSVSIFAAPLLIGLLSPLAGCAATVVPDEGAGLEWVRVTEAQSALLALLYEGKYQATTSEEAAKQCAALVRMKVGACVEATVTGASVSYTFTGCKDLPYGLTTVSGVVASTYTVEGGNDDFFIGMTAEGTGISLDGATLELKASVHGSPPDLLPPGQAAGPHASNLFISTTSSGTSKEGHRFTFAEIEGAFPGVVAVYADSDRCVDFDTTSPSVERASGTIESQGLTWVVRAEGFRHCGTSCPGAGGFVAVINKLESAQGSELAGAQGNETPRLLRFDGSATAKLFKRWVDEEDKDTIASVPFQLECTPASK